MNTLGQKFRTPRLRCMPSGNIESNFKSNLLKNTSLVERNPRYQRKKGIILIVDDKPFNILAIQALLRESEFIVESAFNGKEAIEKVMQKSNNQARDNLEYQLIFMDCQMPIMDGFEATEKLCKLMEEKIKKISIVGCTAFTSKLKMDDCLKCGMNDVLNKPVSRKDILEILDKYLKKPFET